MLALLQLRFENGALVQYNANETLRDPLNDIVIYGTRGRVVGRSLTRSRSDGKLAILTEAGETIPRYPAPKRTGWHWPPSPTVLTGGARARPAWTGCVALRYARPSSDRRRRRLVDVNW